MPRAQIAASGAQPPMFVVSMTMPSLTGTPPQVQSSARCG
jgi:hypothetical protein